MCVGGVRKVSSVIRLVSGIMPFVPVLSIAVHEKITIRFDRPERTWREDELLFPFPSFMSNQVEAFSGYPDQDF